MRGQNKGQNKITKVHFASSHFQITFPSLSVKNMKKPVSPRAENYIYNDRKERVKHKNYQK